MSRSRLPKSTHKAAKRTTVVLADDHLIVRKGLRSLLARNSRLKVVGEAKDGSELIDLVKVERPDVAIVDISMPGMSGSEAVQVLKERFPELKILVLTVHNDKGYVSQLMLMGADGYLLKDAEPEEVFSAIRAVMAGRRFFSASVSEVILEKAAAESHQPMESDARRSATPLTERELEILQLIAQGLTSRAIAERLYLSIGTVFTHRYHLMKKLDIHDKAGLVRYAIKMRLVDVNP